MLSSTASDSFWMSDMLQNVAPSVSFRILETKQNHRTKSIKQGGWGTITMLLLVTNSHRLLRVGEQTSRQCGTCSDFLLRSPAKLHNWSQWCLQACGLFGDGLCGRVLRFFKNFLLFVGAWSLWMFVILLTFDQPWNMNATHKLLSDWCRHVQFCCLFQTKRKTVFVHSIVPCGRLMQ
jgi:hypothetical protein